MKYGIDISHWNGNIDFSKVNADFVILKLSQATHKDVKFDEYYSNCKIPKGAYIYNKVKDLAQAKAEAEFAVKSLNGRKLEYGVWLDLEDASMRKLGKPLLEAIITTEADILTKAGYEVGIYCNRDWYLNVLNGERLAKTYKFWIAMRYTVSLKGGQKTGWFYDQRVNRATLASFVQARPGCEVLDAFCYAGAFGALAAKSGAGSVCFLDASSQALSYADRNAEPFVQKRETLQGDALSLLAAMRREGRKFDVVCLDPPAFIKRKKDFRQGMEAYQRVNELGIDLVRPGGIFMTCSCSHHLPAEDLRSIVTRAAGKRRRMARLLFQGFQGADHPIHPAMPETAYLKTFLFQFPE